MAFTRIPDLMLEDPEDPIVLPNFGNVAIFSTQGHAVASSVDESILAIITLGYHADPSIQGGVGYWRYNPAATHGWCMIISGRKYELSVDIADVKIFGAKGNGTGDDSPSIQGAIAYAKMRLPYQVTVLLSPGIFHVATPLIFDYAIKFLGVGRASELRAINITTGVLVANLATAGSNQINFGEIGNFYVSLHLSGGTPQSGNVLHVVGPANSYFQWNYIHDILTAGFNSFLTVDAESHVTAFGNEGPACWNNFERITFANAAGYHLYGFVFNTGSGTGNTFTNNMGFIHNYVWLYQATGGVPRVVGDIMIQGGHWGSYDTVNSRIFAVGSNAQYRSRIRLQGMQGDAGMAGVLSLYTLGGEFDNVVVDVTQGGGCPMGNHPLLTNSSLGFARTNIAAA